MSLRISGRLAAELDELGLPAGFTPPEDVAAAALRGLDLRARLGRGGTEVGVARAQRLAARQVQSASDMRIIAAWFARFAHLSGTRGWADAEAPSTGWIAWQLWGGDAGRAWVEAHRADWALPPKGSKARRVQAE